MRDTLPYPLQHAWIKTWQNVFSGYKTMSTVTTVMLLGREMGEVHRLLPVLIGIYVFAQLVVPHRHSCIKVSSFACITVVVLGGAASTSLKILLHRYRPNAYGDPYMWKEPGTAVVNHFSFSKLDLSFPCGHTTVTLCSSNMPLPSGHIGQPQISTVIQLAQTLVACVHIFLPHCCTGESSQRLLPLDIGCYIWSMLLEYKRD